MANSYGRQVVLTLTNKRGSGVIAGDVVVVDTTNNDAFTTSTAGAVTSSVGIAQETIANNASGRVLFSGYAALINVNASVTRGNFGKTHTVAAQATDAGASRTTGTFCQFLTGGTTPDAILFGYPDSAAGGSGAPTTAQYITGASDGTLSAEKVRADLYKNYHPDNYPTSGTTFSEEWDAGSIPGSWTWDTAPGGTVDATTYPGFLYLTGGTNAGGTRRLLRRTFAPGAAAFSVAAKMHLATANENFGGGIGIRLLDSGDATIWFLDIITDGTTTASDGYRINSTLGVWNTSTEPLVNAPPYLLITRSAANVYKAYISRNGMAWLYLGTSTVATTVAKVAIGYNVDANFTDDDATVDFVRVFTSETKIIGA